MILRMCLKGGEKLKVREVIKEKTGYCIKSTSILNQTFLRSSLAAETGQNSNEIFEFIGDQVLSFYVVKLVSEKCGSLSTTTCDYTFRIRENKFTQIKQTMLSNQTLAEIIDDWDIAKYLLLSKSDIKNEATKEVKVKADLFEAIIGAIAVESSWDPVVLETAVKKALNLEEKIAAIIEEEAEIRGFDIDNAITTLKEIAEKGQCTMPEYRFTGPDILGKFSDGSPKWSCGCTIINEKIGLNKYVWANSKKDAKKAAAYLILLEHLDVQNKYGVNDWFPFWIYKDGKLIPNRNFNCKEM